MADGDTERRIVTGLIVSDDYVRRVSRFWQDDLLLVPELRRVARWCLDHFERYGKVPDRDIGDIYMAALRSESMGKAEAEYISGVLTYISDEYGRGDQFNSAYLYDRTVAYFRERELAQHTEELQDRIDRGEIDEAQEAARSFKPRSYMTSRGLDLGSEAGIARMEQAFAEAAVPVLTFPGDFGEMVNDHLVRDGFVAFLAPEKRGKSFLLIDVAIRALRKRSDVAFFQAGDMTETQMLRRIGIYLARRSDQERYCAAHYQPVGDCVLNQFDACNRKDRNCQHGIFDGPVSAFYADPHEYEKYEVLARKAESNPGYEPCSSKTCGDRRGTVWLKRVPEVAPLVGKRASLLIGEFFAKYKRRFKLMTCPSDSLTCDEIRDVLDEWYRQDDFSPNVVVVDYADLMGAKVSEFRHRQDAIWKGLRAISQERHALVVTATQADADSYKRNRLTASNFSEDKRKIGHVTAMWGLNQSTDGREKDLGIMRVNEIVVREGASSANSEVVILQDLRIGRPFLGSYRKS